MWVARAGWRGGGGERGGECETGWRIRIKWSDWGSVVGERGESARGATDSCTIDGCVRRAGGRKVGGTSWWSEKGQGLLEFG